MVFKNGTHHKSKYISKLNQKHQSLPKLIKVAESTKYTISEAHNNVSNLDLVKVCVKIKPCQLTRIQKNKNFEKIMKMSGKEISPDMCSCKIASLYQLLLKAAFQC